MPVPESLGHRRLRFFDHQNNTMERLVLVFVLSLFTLALILPLYIERTELLARENSRLAASALVVEQSLNRSLYGISRALDNVRTQLPFWRSQPDMKERATRQLKAFADAMPGVRAMFILDGEGTGVAMGVYDLPNLPANQVHKNFAHMAYFQAISRAPDPDTVYVSEPYQTDVGLWAFNLSRAIVDPQGHLQALIVAVIDTNELSRMLTTTRYVDDQYGVIVHGKGKLIYINPMVPKVLGMNLAVPGSFFSNHLASGLPSSLYRGHTLNFTDELLVASQTVKSTLLSMDYPLVVGISRRVDSILDPWRAMLRTRLLILTFIWSLSLLLLWAWQRARHQSREESRAKTLQIEMVFESAYSLLAILDPKGRNLRLSAAWRTWMGWPIEQLEQHQIMMEFAHPDDIVKVKEAQRDLDRTGEVQDFECRLRHAHGNYHDMHVQAHVLNGLTYLNAQDITKERQQQQALQQLNERLRDTNTKLHDKEAMLVQMAQHDGLTQLANRRKFDEELIHQWRNCRRERQPLAVLMIDVDHFKAYNDQHGHLAGDACLQAVAHGMRTCCANRPMDLLARYGGEEFVVLLPDTTASGAQQVAERLRDEVLSLQIPHGASSTHAQVTISVGLAVMVPDEHTQATALLKSADDALYRAKAQGRNQVCCA